MGTKVVNGVRRKLTPEEEAEHEAQKVTSARERPMKNMANLRRERNAWLVKSDWTQYNDSPLDDDAKASWVTYRQELRDLPESVEDPANPVWPSAPE